MWKKNKIFTFWLMMVVILISGGNSDDFGITSCTNYYTKGC
jgi:hypothetical protein